jgi:hypothetical protein
VGKGQGLHDIFRSGRAGEVYPRSRPPSVPS